MKLTLTTLLLLLVGLLPANAQHVHGRHSAYANQKQSHIPSITADEFEGLSAGAGMGFAKPAELNHYPGPKHVLELADSLGLSDEQHEAIESIRKTMAAEAIELGMQYLHAEHELNRLFSEGRATEALVVEQNRRVGELRTSLRNAHLIAHVRTAAILTGMQIDHYDRLRGYIDTE
jgi:hypothetical protein